MKKLALLFLLLPLSAFAAEDNTLSWTPPTTYVNGTPLPASEILGYKINVSWEGVAQTALTAPGGTTKTFVHRVNSRGNWCYTMQTISVDNAVSALSTEACKRVTHGNPNPPTGLTVQ